MHVISSAEHYSHFGTAEHKATDGGLPDGSVFSMVVEDPRLGLPLQKEKPSFKATLGN